MNKIHSHRPLSPHATIYRWPLNAIMSIMHRITGVGLLAGGFLIVWWFFAGAISESYYDFVSCIVTSIYGDLVMLACLTGFWFHFCNGIRHLFWDVGLTFSERNVMISAILGLLGTAFLTALSLLSIYFWYG